MGATSESVSATGRPGVLGHAAWFPLAAVTAVAWYVVSQVAVVLLATQVETLLGGGLLLGIAYAFLLFFASPLLLLLLIRRRPLNRMLFLFYGLFIAYALLLLGLRTAGALSVLEAISLSPPMLVERQLAVMVIGLLAAMAVAGWSNQRIERARGMREHAMTG